MKRVFSFLLMLAMLCSFVPAFAQEEAPAEEPAAEEQVIEAAAEEPADAVAAEEAPAAEEPAQAEEPAAADGTAEIEEPAAEAPAEAPALDGAATITANDSYTAEITSGGGKAYFYFTPTKSGSYTFYSSGSRDTKAALYSASGTVLASDDDSGSGTNFSLVYSMTAGVTYEYAVFYYSTSFTGSIQVTLAETSSASLSYTVKYDANGGSSAPSSQTKKYAQTLTLSTSKPYRYSYTFLGWSESSTAASADYAAGGSYTANASVTLYAVWGADTYTVSYDANGGSGAPDSQAKTYGQTLTLSSTVPTRTGYIFMGWTTRSTSTYVYYAAGSSYTANYSTTLYAVWKANTYTISYDANGGSGAPSGQTKTYGQTLTLRYTRPTRYEYTFLGWSESSTATTADYAAGDSYTANASATLYAVWGINTYTISYNANGGSGAPASQEAEYGQTVTLSRTVPVRSGYTFLGWSSSSSATSGDYAAGGEYTCYGTRTLYAVWEKTTSSQTLSVNKSYTAEITTANGEVYYSFTPSKSGTYALYSTQNDYGYNFPYVRLYDASRKMLASDFGSGEGANFLLSYSLTAGQTYRIVISYYTSSRTGSIPFTFSAAYTITYNANGGSGAPDSQTAWYGLAQKLSSGQPARSGYTFVGWATGSTAATAAYYAGSSYTAKADVTLYAVWSKVPTNGWSQTNGKWSYLQNGKKVTGWKQVSGTWYYFGSDGIMYSEEWCGDYYLKSDGAMATGWCQIEGEWYYFKSSGAVLSYSWLKYGGSWYYLGYQGQMYHAQWLRQGKAGSYYYYYLQASGVMATGWKQIGGTWYYFNSNGVRQKGWLKSGGSWYYLQPGMAESCTLSIGGKFYTFNSSGRWVG